MKSFTRIAMLTCILCMWLSFAIKPYWPKMPELVWVPRGRLLVVDGGLTNRWLTNVTLYVWKPTNHVYIENVVLLGDKSTIHIDDACRDAFVTARNCTHLHGDDQTKWHYWLTNFGISNNYEFIP